MEISALQRRLGIATVFVTHDQGEALTMSDRVAVMRQGRIEQIGSPAEVYERPVNRFVASFIGSINLVAVRTVDVTRMNGMARLDTAAGQALVRIPDGIDLTGELALTVRPERLKLGPADSVPPNMTAWPVRVERVVYLGARIELSLRLADGSMALAETLNDGSTGWAKGDNVTAWFRPEDAWVIGA